jgi:ABC-type uncharacterized transport system involved in gliding motility auxiliary subunit
MGMNLDRSRLAPYTYLVGLFFLVAAGVRYILTRQFDTTFQVTLGLFVLGIAGGILLDPGRVRRLLSGRQARYGSNALLVSLAVLGIIGVVNYLIYQNPKSWDLTEDQQYSLAPETVKILDELDQPVQLKGFYTPSLSGARDNIRPLLEQYQVNSGGKLTFEFIDPDKNPAAVRQYGVTKDASIVVVMGDQTTVVQPVSEQDLTSALIRLANPGNRVVYFLTGHGEHDTASSTDTGYSQVAASLKAKNYTVTALNLLQSGKVPEDAQAVVIAGPQLALSSDEVKMLQDYQAGGGSLVVLYEPSVSTKISATDDPLQSYLEQTWGISFQDDLIVDFSSTLPLAGLASSYANHPITQRLQGQTTFYPTARSLAITTASAASRSVTALVNTSQGAWGETNIQMVVDSNQAQFDEGSDFPGPLAVGAVGQDSSSGSRLVVFGDSDFADNSYYFNYANGDLLINSIDWAAKQDALIDLTPKQSTSRFVAPPSIRMLGLVFLVTIILLPGGALGTGVIVWWQRRRRR